MAAMLEEAETMTSTMLMCFSLVASLMLYSSRLLAQTPPPPVPAAEIDESKSADAAVGAKGYRLPGTNYLYVVNGSDPGALRLAGASADSPPIVRDQCPPLPAGDTNTVLECFALNPISGQAVAGTFKYNKRDDGTPQSAQFSIPADQTPDIAPLPDATPAKNDTATLLQAFHEATTVAGLTGKIEKPDEPRDYYSGDTAILFFDAAGLPLFGPHPQVDEDDLIVAVIASSPDKPITDASTTKCTAPSKIRIAGTLSSGSVVLRNLLGSRDKVSYKVVYGTHCSAETGMEVTFKVGSGNNQTLSIPTLALYRLAVSIGFIYDWTQNTTFRLSQVKGDTSNVIVNDTQIQGISAVAFVTLHIFAADTVRNKFTRNPLEWISPAVGISFTDPTAHLYLGANVELCPGIGVLVGYHHLKTASLGGGYAVGDRFSGVTVPVDTRWSPFDSSHIYLGFSLDSQVLASLLQVLNR